MIVTSAAPLSSSVTVALTPAEKAALSAAAKDSNTSMSAYTRAAILARLKA